MMYVCVVELCCDICVCVCWSCVVMYVCTGAVLLCMCVLELCCDVCVCTGAVL